MGLESDFRPGRIGGGGSGGGKTAEGASVETTEKTRFRLGVFLIAASHVSVVVILVPVNDGCQQPNCVSRK